MALDIPIAEVSTYIEDALKQFGVGCIISGIATKIMVSDIQKYETNYHETQKQAVVSKTITIQKGTNIIFDNGTSAIVVSTPSDDLVSYSMKILLCNSLTHTVKKVTVYDENTGDIIGTNDVNGVDIHGYVERVSAREKQFDIGILNDTVLKFVTFIGADIHEQDVVVLKNKTYKVIDVDDITDGLLVLQLATVRI